MRWSCAARCDNRASEARRASKASSTGCIASGCGAGRSRITRGCGITGRWCISGGVAGRIPGSRCGRCTRVGTGRRRQAGRWWPARHRA